MYANEQLSENYLTDIHHCTLSLVICYLTKTLYNRMCTEVNNSLEKDQFGAM